MDILLKNREKVGGLSFPSLFVYSDGLLDALSLSLSPPSASVDEIAVRAGQLSLSHHVCLRRAEQRGGAPPGL